MHSLIKKQHLLFSEKWAQLFLPLTLLVLPFSSSLKSILFSISLITILLVPSYRQNIQKCFSLPYVRLALCFFLVILAATLWSPANSHQKTFVIGKYSKFLYLPILIAGFQ
ncbi:MAG: hypothetical protein QNK11_05855, partial [Legionella sp.]|nr:hypothetical protein [Legionella sp.]